MSLTKEVRNEQYANMLTRIIDHERRSMCIQLAIRHFGPSNALDVVRLAVDMIVNADPQDLTFVTTDIGYVQKSKNRKNVV